MTDTVRVEGLSALVRALKAADQDLDDLKDANQAAGKIVLDAALPDVPRRTGRLAASGRLNRAAKKVNIIFGSAAVPYAAPIHWGWPARHIKAQPFVDNAATRTEDRWVGAYETEIQKLLDGLGGA